MMKKTMKKIACALLATMSVFGCAATMSGCTTSHPKVEMEIAFNGETYTLEYTLYRKTASATVEHFLWLADNGYYDGLAVHDYDTANSRMYTGAYSVDGENNLVYKKYYEVIAGYANYGDFPHTVWQDAAKTLPTYTLKGEFADNHFEVESGALQEKFGSLTMHYESISTTSAAGAKVSIERASDGKMDRREYQYNHAKSAFFISLNTNPKTNSNYCTFAYLDEDSEDELKDLQSAIDAYIENNVDDGDEFTNEEETRVFDDEMLFDATEKKTYDVPAKAIVINKVKVKKF